MRLVRLQVEHFGPVRKACVELGLGLNVLYGENDLGKSYLAHAIRAVLLLPHTSTAHQEFVAWGTDETPRVDLTFQTKDETYWRVRKAFGKTAGAAATLERSPNAEQWSMEAKGRDVDGHLRRLLEWGIPEPGAKGKPWGLPTSFLTHVLLAEQDGATAVFEKSLVDDPDESGKRLLGQALQALAQDPLFKTVLEHSQQKVDEAFLPTGKKRRGQYDPFPGASRAIREAQIDHQKCKEQLEETRRVEEKLRLLSQERLEAQGEKEDAAAALASLEALWQKQQELHEIEARLAEAEDRIAKVEAAETAAANLAVALAEREEELEQAEEALRRAGLAAEEARERLRRAESDEGAHQRELEKEQLGKRLLELQAAEGEARSRLEAAKKAGGQLEVIKDLVAQQQKRQDALRALRNELAALVEKKEALERSQRLQRGVGALLRRRNAVADLEEAKAARDHSAELRAEAKKLRAEGDSLVANSASRRLPDTDRVRELRVLAQGLEVAQAGLDVGLSVRLRLARALDLEVSRDGGEPVKTAGAAGEHRFESERALALKLGDVAAIDVQAGAAEARRKAEELARRWEEEAVPVLRAAGVVDVEALEEALRAAEQERRLGQERLAESARLEAKVAELAALASGVEACEARAREREGALEGLDRSALEAVAATGGNAEAVHESRLREIEEALQKANAEREEKRAELGRAESDLSHFGETLEAKRRASAEVLAAFDEPWEVVLAEAEAKLSSVAEEMEDVMARRAALTETQGTELAELQASAEAATMALEQARALVKSRMEARDAARGALEGKRGERGVLRENAEKIDLATLRATAEEKRAATAAQSGGAEPVTEQRLVVARQSLDEAVKTLSEKSGEVGKLEGALEQVGGDVAVEREKMAQEALLVAKDRERDLELEYGAWSLLVETLREAENEESSHLGRALIGPVSERFSELTNGRYGRIGLDPDLKMTGIEAGGGDRDAAALSQGLKEQLATIFRISVAQHLESVIVLDDHLTNADPDRLSWFREVLRRCGEEIQIVVLTCRPTDYLLDGELAGEGKVVWDGSSGRISGVNLQSIVDRAGVMVGG